MAEALIGGSFLSAFLQVLFDRMASPQVLGFIKGQKLDDGLLKDLKVTMRSVNKLLKDAEEKQITDSEVKDWLDDLKDAVYEADDFFDEITSEATRLELEAGSRTITDQGVSLLSSFSPFNKEREKLIAKLEEISRTLDRLLKKNSILGLKEVIGQKESTLKLPTTSLPEDSLFYGREDDQEAIVKLLLSPYANGKTLGAIPIVGMGGVGKTTLVQFVFNDSRVQNGFDLKAWICVSVDFDVQKLTKDILMEVRSQNCDAKTVNGLHQELEDTLRGRKILVVLDDVWSSEQSRWDFLLKPFNSVAEGSKIIVTSRNENIVPAMQRAIPRNRNKEQESSPSPIPTHRLMGLTEENCWILFKEHAFNGEDPREQPDLQGIGRQIASKCKGLPLAAKTLGRLLCFERNAEKWEEILKSRIWESPNDEIIPALRLSYYYLPPHLKRCFAFCSIYPKDYKFVKEDVVLLWLAEGLVQPKGCKEMVKLGKENFDDLLSRSFFQRSRWNESVFVMHDLLNDLAKVVSGEFSFTLVGDCLSKISRRVRHLSYATTDYDALDKFEGIDKAQFLRTFLPLSHRWSSRIDSKVQHDLLSNFMRLRVLSLAPYHNVVELHDSIGRLKHLRYLDLTATPLKKLPEFVCSLYNLQTLLLDSCMCLVELPNSIGNLKNLLQLRLHWTAIQRLPESVVNLSNLQTLVLSECKNLIELPTNMGKLTKLERLTDFFVGKQSGIADLVKLQNLQGELRIWNLQNVLPSQDDETAKLLDKQRVKELELRWAGDTDDSQHERRVLEKLKPHKDVKRLSIVGFGGTRFPDWVGNSSFPNIVFLKLKGCKYCTSLPPLGLLVSLKELRIEAFDLIDVVGPELFGSGESRIRILSFEDMEEWREWNLDGVTFPLLQLLQLRCCPELRGALPSHLPVLEELCVDRCPLLVASLSRAPTIRQMELSDTSRSVQLTKYQSGMLSLMVHKFHSQDSPLQGIKHIGVSTALEKIEVHCCDSLKLFQPKLFPKLEILHIWDSPHLESLVDLNTSSLSVSSLHIGGLSLPNLSELCVVHCPKLKSLPQGMHILLPSLKSLSVEDCLELESFPEGGLPSKLQSLNVQNCNKLIDSRERWGLQSLLSLSKFRIGYNEDVESFPEEMLLPSTLTSLTLSCLENLKYLNYKGLQHLTSLAKLTINSCPKLESLQEEGLAASKLQSLAIWGCHNLIARRMQWNLWKLSSLSRFRIGYCDDVESFPDEILLPSTVTSLEIWSLEKLKYLNYMGLQHLTSLTRLKIRFCHNLESMPEEKLPSSLTYLDIYGCPVLEKKCEKEKGEDCPRLLTSPT